MEAPRLYGLGELMQDVRDLSLDEWHREVGRGATKRSTDEKKLAKVMVSVEYAHTGLAWISVQVTGKRQGWTRDYLYRAYVRPADLFEYVERV